MAPRISPRRCFLYLVAGASVVLLVINVRQRDWPTSVGLGSAGGGGPTVIPLKEEIAGEDFELNKRRGLYDIIRDRLKSKKQTILSDTSIDKITYKKKWDSKKPSGKPWYMPGGTVYPTPAEDPLSVSLFPAEEPGGVYDRIERQLMYMPSDVPVRLGNKISVIKNKLNLNAEETNEIEGVVRNKQKNGSMNVGGGEPKIESINVTAKSSSEKNEKKYFSKAWTNRVKMVLAFNGMGAWGGVRGGKAPFSGCPVDACRLSADRAAAPQADMIIFKDHFVQPSGPRPIKQIWMLYYLECPYHTQAVKKPDVFNWTSTYRRDSDIVAPYERWASYHPSLVPHNKTIINYAANKTKKVAWFVSNCGARNNRLQYARELQKHIQVDIYGACGTMRCARTDSKCFEMLDKDYKFYLAFENSNCRDYITEKFFVNGLGRNVLPIVMGARPEDYARVAPRRSYIHVDEFASPRELAAYLMRLDADDKLYNSYFKWKGTGEFINTYFWCRVCSMLHHQDSPTAKTKTYADVNEWWRGGGVCTPGSWRRRGSTGSAPADANLDDDELQSPASFE